MKYEILHGDAFPVVQCDLQYGESIKAESDAMIAMSASLELTGNMDRNILGGLVFLSSFGAIHSVNLEAGEEVIIDNGHLVAWPDYMQYRIEKASNGWVSSVISGECLVCRFTGPGVILIQTRKPEAFSKWMQGMLPPSRSS